MPLRLAFDLDGVLADMEGALARQAEVLFGDTRTAADREPPEGSSPEETAGDVPPLVRLRLTARQQRRLWNHVETIENFWESLGELEPGAVARLYELAAARRWEVIFLTKRPDSAGATAQVQSQRWLEARGFTLPSVFVVRGSRGRIADALALDVLVDDRPENCLDVVVDSRARAILVWREEEGQLPAAVRRLGIGVVASVEQCLDILDRNDGGAGEASGVVNRVMRLLGLKEPAGV